MSKCKSLLPISASAYVLSNVSQCPSCEINAPKELVEVSRSPLQWGEEASHHFLIPRYCIDWALSLSVVLLPSFLLFSSWETRKVNCDGAWLCESDTFNGRMIWRTVSAASKGRRIERCNFWQLLSRNVKRKKINRWNGQNGGGQTERCVRGWKDIMKGRFYWRGFWKLAGPLGSVTFLSKCFGQQIQALTHSVGMLFRRYIMSDKNN